MSPRLTAEQEVEYLHGIGASEVPKLLGLSSFGGLHDVVLARLEPKPRGPETLAQQLGHELEPIVARLVESRYGIVLRNRSETIWHPAGLRLFCHIDRKVELERAVCEIKTSAWESEWGEPGDGPSAVPAATRAQVAAQLACTRYDYALVAVLIGGRDVRLYRLERDFVLEEAIEEAVAEAWDYIDRGEIPAPDGSEGSRAYLRRRFATDNGVELVATAEQRLLLADLRAAKAEVAAAEARVELLEQQVMAAMAEASRLVAPEGRISWRVESPRADYRAIAAELATAAGADLEVLVEAQKEGRQGPRVLRCSWTKQKGQAA